MGRQDKFSPSKFNLDLVPRRWLVDAVCSSIASNAVTLIVAPTGSGKSALLSQTLEALPGDGAVAVWYNCDHFDREAGRFVSMLDQALAGQPEDAGRERSTIEALLSADDPKGLVDAIVERGCPVVLFIDNFHLCDSEETSEALDVLIRESRGLLHVAIGSRRTPRLSLGHLRLRGLVGEFGAGDLAFSVGEARHLIGEDCPTDADAVDRVIQRTEGWAAGLQLVRLLVRVGASLRRLAEEFSGADRDIGQLLNEEVCNILPPALRDFLLQVSVLDRISAELAEAVTGDTEAPYHFRDMQERNLFVLPLDRQGRQVRLHAMFRDFLMTQAAHLDTGLAGRSLRRAATWHWAQGEWIEAIDYAFRAGDFALAAEWLDKCAPDLLARRGETARFLSCAERLPSGVELKPRVVFWMIWAALFSGDYERAGELMNVHAEVLAQTDANRSQVELLRFLVAYFTHRYVDALSLGKTWLEGDPVGEAFDRATVTVAMALCHRTQLDMVSAQRCLDLARYEIARAPTSYGLAWISTLTAQFLLLQGRVSTACHEIEGMLTGLHPSDLIRGSSELVLADVYYERGALDQARKLIRRSLPTIAQHGNIDIALCGWRVAARLTLLTEGPEAALELLRGVEHLSIRRFGGAALRMIHLLRNEIILDLGAEIRRSIEIDDSGESGDEAAGIDTPELKEWCRLLSAKRNLVSGNPRRAIADILPVITATRASGRLRLWVQASCVKAAAHFADGEPAFAIRTLMEAVECAATHGMVRSILDHDAILRPLGPLIGQYMKTNRAGLSRDVTRLVDLLTAALPALPEEDFDDEEVAFPTGIRLSKKEYRVLTMVSQGLTNGQIAERLFISLPTVKWHLRNIFGKLDVRTRTAAVAKARSISMLQ